MENKNQPAPKKQQPPKKQPVSKINKKPRRWNVASRLEHRLIKGKNRKKPGIEK